MSALQTIYHQFGEEIYKSGTCLYKSLKNEDYMYKKTVLAVMCQLAMARISKLKSPFAENILIFYLKNLKSRLQNHSEMVELPAELIVDTAESMLELDNLEFYKSNANNEIQVFNSCKQILKRCGPDFIDSELTEVTGPAFEALPIKGNVKMYQKIVAETSNCETSYFKYVNSNYGTTGFSDRFIRKREGCTLRLAECQKHLEDRESHAKDPRSYW
ncbi:hypothetical protein CAEBREN_13316 [Caenorhabditis brenneri]|uniref:DUF7809 domain-containing protein n=1 Tax=Caenorhabditis brenneri TaxID=135651 RepID=G0NHA3_CAEBE|nr:hypothetical protein CAEBREN_13316 [Caenorhabditis brenneri]